VVVLSLPRARQAPISRSGPLMAARAIFRWCGCRSSPSSPQNRRKSSKAAISRRVAAAIARISAAYATFPAKGRAEDDSGLTAGNAYVGKFRDGDGRLEQLSLLDPANVQVELVAGAPRYTVTDPKTGRESFHSTDDILHVRALSTDGLVGLSPLKSCRLALE